MRLTLTTKHRRVLILTGPDLEIEEDDTEPAGFVRLDTGDLSIAPDPPLRDDADYSEEDHSFGFGR